MNFPTVCLPSQISRCRWQYLDISLPAYVSSSTEPWSWQLGVKCSIWHSCLGNPTMNKCQHTSAVSEAVIGDLHYCHTSAAERVAGGSHNIMDSVLCCLCEI